MEPSLVDAILGATIVDFLVRIGFGAAGGILTVFGFWGVRRRLRALEERQAAATPVVNVYNQQDDNRVLTALREMEDRAEETMRRVRQREKDAQMRRIAEAIALRHVDPEKRERMADKLSEKWEQEWQDARCADDEQPR